MNRLSHSRPSAEGQALVEFSLAIIVFLMLLMGIFDFGRGIYMYNGVSQAAREVARIASVHQVTSGSGYSVQAQGTIDTQRALIPGLTFVDPVCVASQDADDSTATGGHCAENSYIVVTAQATFSPVSLLGFLGNIALEAKSRIQIPLSQTK